MTTHINKENFIAELKSDLISRYSFGVTNNIMKSVIECLDANSREEKIVLPDIEKWIKRCCKELNQPIGDVFSKSRKQEYVWVRNALAYILTNLYKIKQDNVAEYFGWTRSNVSTACKAATLDMKQSNPQFIQIYNTCYNCLF